MKVKVDGIEIESIVFILNYNDSRYQVSAELMEDDTYRIYYHEIQYMGRCEIQGYEWTTDSSGATYDDYPDTDVSSAIMDILFNEDNPMIKEF
jgi:hypothetical protein